MQKTIEQKVEEQDSLIKKFQLLIQHEGVFSQVIGNFPYPIAIFERSGVLTMANQAMARKACIRSGDIEEKQINFLSRVTTENANVLKAAEDTFSGETTLVQSLEEPLSLFAGEGALPDHSDGYQKAVFFPVFANNGSVTHGVVMLMK
jgi:hypothetical protein